MNKAEFTHKSVIVAKDAPFTLQSGKVIESFPIAYETFGTLNDDKSNVVFICHALTGDQYVTGTHPITGKEGWWSLMVGPGKVIDTDRYYVICSNGLGGGMGSFGPNSINPKTNAPYNMDFPVITIGDMVRAQKLLLDQLAIDKIFCLMGGSMGGMQVLDWVARFPEKVFAALPIASAAKHSAQNIAFHEIGRQAIMADPNWHQGNYQAHDTKPTKGLGVARMISHVTYQSEDALKRKFGRNLQDRKELAYGFEADFQIESYLRHQGSSFVERFDANTYFYITRAANYFDLAEEFEGELQKALSKNKTRFCVISFSSDWLFPTQNSQEIVRVLNANGAKVSFVEIETDSGHDSFLLDDPVYLATVRGFVEAAARDRGI